MSKGCFFFSQTIGNVCTNYPLLFNEGVREDGDEEGGERYDHRQLTKNDISTFGIIPYCLKYCEVTNEKITDVMNESINFVFYIVSYEILKAKEQEKMLKQIRTR